MKYVFEQFPRVQGVQVIKVEGYIIDPQHHNGMETCACNKVSDPSHQREGTHNQEHSPFKPPHRPHDC